MTEIHENTTSLVRRLEALLFVSSGPVAAAPLAAALSVSPTEIQQAIKDLAEEYIRDRSIRIQQHGGRYQLTTAPEYASDIEHFLGLEGTSRLSKAALETLAMIAYQQPITRPRLDAIRGVNSDGVLKSLLSKGLIQEVGRAEAPGRPILYGTTPDFLQYFGLNGLQELPPLELPDELMADVDRREIFKD